MVPSNPSRSITLIFLKSPASHLKLPFLPQCRVAPCLKTSFPTRVGMNFCLWGCYSQFSVRKTSPGLLLSPLHWRALTCRTFFPRISKRKRQCHGAGWGKQKSPARGALLTIVVLFRSLSSWEWSTSRNDNDSSFNGGSICRGLICQ